MAHSRTKTSNKPSLKSKGAGYSTTNRKGETTYYKSSKDAPGYSDTFEGKGTSSKGNAPIAKVNATGNAIPVTELNTTTTPVTLPNMPKVTDPGAINLTGSPDLTSLGYSTKDNQFVYDPKASESENAVNQSTQNQMQLLLQSFGLQGEQESKADLYEDTYGVSDRQAKRDYEAGRRDVSNYTSQLNNIVAKAQAESLGLEGQGRGITESIIGGQQAQINREAAIQALPIQAQLASSQANLEEATRHLDNLFKLKSQDADAKYKRQSDMVQAVLGVASQGQQNLLTAKLADIGERKKTADANRALVNEYAKMAIQSGQSNLITGFTSLDVNAPDFAQKFGAMQAKVIDTTSALQRDALRAQIASSNRANQPSTARDTQFNANGDLVDMQTGQIISSAGGAGSTAATQKSLDQISFLQRTINDATGLVDASGPNMISQGLGNFFVGNTRAKQLANKLDTLKTNLLTLNSDPALKKFFGPQMTEKDTQLLMSAGSTLNAYSASEADNRAELTRYSELLNRMQTAIQNGGMTFGIVLTGADGLQYQISD